MDVYVSEDRGAGYLRWHKVDRSVYVLTAVSIA